MRMLLAVMNTRKEPTEEIEDAAEQSVTRPNAQPGRPPEASAGSPACHAAGRALKRFLGHFCAFPADPV
jgi:hypothetical protein